MGRLQSRVSPPGPFAQTPRITRPVTTPSGPGRGSRGAVAPAESMASARQPSQASKDALLDAAVRIVQATVHEGESYL